eukprot:5020318-Amphidinium_carterae.2
MAHGSWFIVVATLWLFMRKRTDSDASKLRATPLQKQQRANQVWLTGTASDASTHLALLPVLPMSLLEVNIVDSISLCRELARVIAHVVRHLKISLLTS